MIELRELGPHDTVALLRIYSPEATRHLDREAMDAAEARYYLRDAAAAAAQTPRTLYVLGLVVDGDLVGVVKLHRDRPVAAVGYILRADAWGRGYATEGVRRILALAFGRLGLPEVRAKHRPENPASGRVLRKAGFVPTGEHDGYATYAMRAPTPREVAVEVRPVAGYELEIEGADDRPFVTFDDMDDNRDEVVSQSVREALGIPGHVPLVLMIKDSYGPVARTEESAVGIPAPPGSAD
ncbi:GNAT family N-acetyltransferase [Kitasatospora sp. CB01950]|uniref:GNAT family N-acetyltransferase n=1 Tax=Kitasatospora sp. CB01950 TaxID=1703930 RepID=UPI00093CBAB7|nr:GNAT family N-acetyltransferase [Kitasatospora sp. CB01950]